MKTKIMIGSLGLWLWAVQAQAQCGVEIEVTELGTNHYLFEAIIAHQEDYVYDWIFGDGATGSGQSVEHEYAETGSYTVNLLFSSSTCEQVVIEQIGGTEDNPDNDGWQPYYHKEGFAYTFYIPESAGEGDASDTFTWDFGDGSATVTGREVSHTYEEEVDETLDVTVTYDMTVDGHSDTGTKTVEVLPTPTCNLQTDWTEISPMLMSFSADPVMPGEITWDFGEGIETIEDFNAQHIFDAPGTYEVLAHWMSSTGSTCTDTYEVQVTGSSDGDGGDGNIDEGDDCGLTMSVTHNGGLSATLTTDETNEELSYTWTINNETINEMSATYTFPAAGSYVILANIDDHFEGIHCKVVDILTISESGAELGVDCDAIDVEIDVADNGIDHTFRIITPEVVGESTSILISSFQSNYLYTSNDTEINLSLDQPGIYKIEMTYSGPEGICDKKVEKSIRIGPDEDCAFVAEVDYASRYLAEITINPIFVDVEQVEIAAKLTNGATFNEEFMEFERIIYHMNEKEPHDLVVTVTYEEEVCEQTVPIDPINNNPCYFEAVATKTGDHSFDLVATTSNAGTFEWTVDNSEEIQTGTSASYTLTDEVEHAVEVTFYGANEVCESSQILGINSPYDDCPKPEITWNATDNAIDFSASVNIEATYYGYHWIFGDGTSGASANTRHVYDETGSFHANAFYYTMDADYQLLCFGSDIATVDIENLSVPTYSIDLDVQTPGLDFVPLLVQVFHADDANRITPIQILYTEESVEISHLEEGNYILLALTLNYFTNELSDFVPTYSGNTEFFDDAQVIKIDGSSDRVSHTLTMVAYTESDKEGWNEGSDQIGGSVVGVASGENSTGGRLLQSNDQAEAIQNAIAYLHTPSGELLSMTYTNEEGNYSFDNIGAGSYEVTIEYPYASHLASFPIEVDGSSDTQEDRLGIAVVGRQATASNPVASVDHRLLEPIRAYPNPAKSVIHFTHQMKTLALYDISGTQIGVFKNVSSIQTESLKSGLYLMIADGQVLRHRIE